jgi:hypothetical protein
MKQSEGTSISMMSSFLLLNLRRGSTCGMVVKKTHGLYVFRNPRATADFHQLAAGFLYVPFDFFLPLRHSRSKSASFM